MCLGSQERSWVFAAASTVASVLGGLAGYAIGAFAWSALAVYFYQWIPGFSPEAFANIQSLYLEWGVIWVFAAGFSPIPFKLFTVASGVAGLPILPFLAAAAAASRGAAFLFGRGFDQAIRRAGQRYYRPLLQPAGTALLRPAGRGFMLIKVVL